MSDLLDKSLDDIMSSKRTGERRSGGGERRERKDSTSRRPVRTEARRGVRERQNQRGDRRQERPEPRDRDTDSRSWGHDGYERMAAVDGVRVLTSGGAMPAAMPVSGGAASMPPLRTSTTTKITLINLDPGALEDGLRSILSQMGELESVSIERNADGSSVGCGEAVFKTYEGAATAVAQLDGRNVDGRKLIVKIDPAAMAAAQAVVAAPGRTTVVLPGRGIATAEVTHGAHGETLSYVNAAFMETESASRARMPRGGYERVGGGSRYDRDDRGHDDRRGRDRGDDRRGGDRDGPRGRGRDEDRSSGRKAAGGRSKGPADIEAEFARFTSGKGEAKPAAAARPAKGGKGKRAKASSEDIESAFDAYLAEPKKDAADAAPAPAAE